MKNYAIFAAFFFGILILGCISAKEIVKSGDTVTVEYNLTIDNGTLIDTTTGGKPYTFVVGSNSTIKGFSYGIIGMSLNETKTMVIEPKDAYGEWYQSKVKTTKIGNSNYTIGEKVTSMLTKEAGIITFVNSTHVTANFNHPLAGKNLTFVVKVTNITNTKDYFNP